MKPATLTTIDLGEACRVLVRTRDPETDALAAAPVVITASGPNVGTVPVTVEDVAPGVVQGTFTPTSEGTWLVTATLGGALSGLQYGLVKVRPVPTVQSLQ